MPTTTATSLTPADQERFAAVERAKLEALYQFAYGLSHEINNPLANIATRAQTLLIDERDPERRRKLATINQQAFRAHEMIADLMLFARPPTPRKEPTDLVALASRVLTEIEPLAKEQGTALVGPTATEPIMATVDPTQIAVALRAIVQNSLEALGRGGRVELRIADCGLRIENPEEFQVSSSKLQVGDCNPHFPDTPHSALRTPHFSPAPHFSPTPQSAIRNPQLTILDTGPGIPPHIRPHIFDPFFSGREAGRGLGLGLSKAWRIVDLHGGSITVESPEGGGADFTIELPGE